MKPVRKRLSKVSIGSYVTENYGRSAVLIEDNDLCVRQGSLYDQRMGYLNTPGWPASDGDHAACFGTMGYIPLKYDMLNPVFDSNMLMYLSLYEYVPGLGTQRSTLKMRDGVAELVIRYKTLKGYRKLKAISEDIVSTNPWKIWDEKGGVKYKIRNKKKGEDSDEYIEIDGNHLKELLSKATKEYTSEDADVTLWDIGINPDVAKPEDFIRGDIPVLPNIMRAPQKGSDVSGSCVQGKHHPFTEHYVRIYSAIRNGDASDIRKEWMNLIKNGDTENLKSAVFSSDKRAFLRGGMFAKVGGQMARSVVAPNPRQRPDQVGIPRRLAKDISYRLPITTDNMDEVLNLIREGHVTHVLHTKTGEYIKIDEFSNLKLEPGKMLVLRELRDGDVVLANRQPTLHKNSILGFEVFLHDYDVIYIHPSATKSFGMDFDGDEANCLFSYTPLGQREIKELMFVEYHMASLASSSLLVGYHQDVNLASHILTMNGTYVPVNVWNEMTQVSYETRWKDKYATYDEWLTQYKKRLETHNIEPYSGRGLYSTLLPEDMNWRLDNNRIIDGILISGLLDSKITTGSSSSIGMVMYRTYGSRETIYWLNASYRMLNLYLIQKGTTLGFSHLILSDTQDEAINDIKSSIRNRDDLKIDTDSISDQVIRSRIETEITQELSNARETVSVEVMNPKNIDISTNISGTIIGNIILWIGEYSIYPYCNADSICVLKDPIDDLPGNIIQEEDRIIIPEVDGTKIDIDLYSGSITWIHNDWSSNGGAPYVWSMALFPSIEVTLSNGETITRDYTGPNHLRTMIASGARGNATNAIQIAGIVGQQSFGGGRIPRMLDASQTSLTATLSSDNPMFLENTGTRSMPCYPFGTNTPISRGFIYSSYLEGMKSDEYMSAHVASRENLTSNTDLTPRTGYFERRVRTFTENLRVSKIRGRTAITNERGIIIMYDYIFDPSKIFSINKNTTFVDIQYEMMHLQQYTGRRAVYIHIPYRSKMIAYLRIDEKIRQCISQYTDDIIITCDPRIEYTHEDFYVYLRDILPNEFSDRKIVVFTIPTSLSTNKRDHFYLSLTDYDEILVYSLADTRVLKYDKLYHDMSAYIDVKSFSINEIAYPSVQKDSPIPLDILYQAMTYGTNFSNHPYIVRTSIDAYNMLDTMSLIEVLISIGDVYSI